jgi:oligopeptide transport system permease protein
MNLAGRFAGRLAAVAAMALFVIFMSFLVMRAVPGGPFDRTRTLSPVVRANLEHRYGLDRPAAVQFTHYVAAVLRGDFGDSLSRPERRVAALIGEGAGTSATVGGAALLIALLLGIPLGLAAARGIPGAGLVTATGLATPTFVLGPLLVLVFALKLGWLPVTGEGALGLVLPIATLAAVPLAEIARLTRAGAAEVLDSTFVRAARCRGLDERTVLLHYVLAPALRPVVAYLGPLAAGILTGSLVVERLYALPGSGAFLIDGALARDYPLVLGATLAYLGVLFACTLIADLIGAWLDPRLRAPAGRA